MKRLLSNKKILFGGIGAIVVVIGIITALLLLSKDEEAYRTIKVYQIDGAAEVTRNEKESITPYENMMLENKDQVRTFEESYLYLKMDEDKYVLAEPLTFFRLEATGTPENSKTKINLEEGAIVNHITSPLSDDSSYEVDTPNSTMAIRGTSFRVFVWYDENGVSHTILQVFEGVVEVRLRYPDGSLSEPRRFGAGTTVCIWGDSETSDYEYVNEEIDYYGLSIPTLEFLKIGIEGLDEYSIDIPDVDEIIRLKQTYFDVTFKVEDRVFGTQSVLFDHAAKEPEMQPTQNGHWDFKFDTKIREKTDILWVEE